MTNFQTVLSSFPIMYAAFEHYCVYKKYPSLSKVFYFTILTFLIYLLKALCTREAAKKVIFYPLPPAL